METIKDTSFISLTDVVLWPNMLDIDIYAYRKTFSFTSTEHEHLQVH